MAQSEYGDVYKITLDYNNNDVLDMTIKYFDTIPVATSLHLTKFGFLLATSEVGDHCLYQVVKLGEDDAAEASYSTFLGEDGTVQVPVFSPRELTNIYPVDYLPSHAPLLKLRAEDVKGDHTPQLYALCGRGSRSQLRVLQQGLSITTFFDNTLPYVPRGIWTLRDISTNMDRYMVISFNNATIVLSVGDSVEQVADTGFQEDESTLLAGMLEGDSMLQVSPGGFRQIFKDSRIKQWEPPSRRSIVCAAMNTRQIAVALSNGEVLYFELDERLEWVERESMNMKEEVTCLDLPLLQPNSLRSSFLVVGYGDRSCRVYTLHPNSLLEEIAMLALPSIPSDVTLEIMKMGTAGHATESLMLTVGMDNGMIMRVEVDEHTGKLGTARSTRFLGPLAVRLFKIIVAGYPCILALSSKPWLCYCAGNTMMLSPLVSDSIEFAANFSSSMCSEGIVCLHGSDLRIIRVNDINQPFASTSISLSYTPRQMAFYPEAGKIIIVETDHNAYSEIEKQRIYQSHEGVYVNEYDCGAPIPTENDKWASCIRVVDANTLQTIERLELANNEAAFSVCVCKFQDKGDESFVIIGTAKDLKIHPRECHQGFINVFRFVEGRSLQLLHRTEVEEVPAALCPFNGKLAAGIGHTLRVYDLGKKKLLRKCENKTMPYFITTLTSMGERLYAGDLMDNVSFLKYREGTNQLVEFADGAIPRSITSMDLLDYNTIVCGDKGGNLFVERADPKIDDDIANPTGSRVLWDAGFLNAAPNKAEQAASIYLGEIVTSVQKTTLIPGGDEVVLYGTIFGTIGALLPIPSRDDLHHMMHIEMFLRKQEPSLVGRDVLSWRSAYTPMKVVL